MAPRALMPRFLMLRSFVPRLSSIAKPILPLSSRTIPSSPTRISLTNRPPALHSHSFTHLTARHLTSPPPSSSNPMSELPPNASISDRLKHLIKSYGWYALGVYFILSAVDFSIAFAGINLLGAEHVSQMAQSVKEYFTSMIHSTPPEPGKQEIETVSSGHEGLYAMAVLAYTVHKTLFLPLRVGLTAAVTPKLVGWLRMRGWAGGAGTMRAAREMRNRVGRNRNQK